jgi:hypothetical protein
MLRQKLENFVVWKTGLLSSVWTLETNTSQDPKFLEICILVEQVTKNNVSLRTVL